MKQRTVCIFGGSGFVGQHLIRRLAKSGWHCVVPSRRPHRHADLKLIANTSVREVETLDEATLRDCMSGCDAVVNLVGILNEDRVTTFAKVHVALVERIIAAAQAAGVPRLLHMSALHAHPKRGRSAYLRSKGAGEQIAHAAAGLAVTSFRPSVIFGRGDSFFNRFATLLEMAPGVFPLACPDARFAPIWVGDVAEAMARSLDDSATIGRRFDLCGPRTFTLEELVSYTAGCIGRRVLLAGLNDWGSRTQARLFELLPGKPFTRDNYQSMQTPSICDEHNGLLELGIHPTDIETIVPTYLG